MVQVTKKQRKLPFKCFESTGERRCDFVKSLPFIIDVN